jgi:NADH-quinone oxidoreductase subunit L
MLTSILAGVGGIGLAYYLYRLRPELPGALAARFAGLHRLLVNKYFVDEAYIGLIVKPTLAFGRGVLLKVVDIGIIDGVVNGVPRLIGRISERMRLVQDGQVSHYLAWVGGGAVLLLVVLVTGL